MAHVNEPPYYFNPTSSRIGYPVKDSIDYSVVHGYRTAFAYLAEDAKGTLRIQREATLDQALSLRFICGQFSYAKFQTTKIFGVSGTLEALSPTEKTTMRQFDITAYKYIPSVYGTSNFQFDHGGRGIVIEKVENAFYQQLTEEINQIVRDDRAVICFFETREKLDAFQSSPYGRKIRTKIELTTDLSKDTKTWAIKRATTAGQVTLAEAVFGRGTDFFCKDRLPPSVLGRSCVLYLPARSPCLGLVGLMFAFRQAPRTRGGHTLFRRFYPWRNPKKSKSWDVLLGKGSVARTASSSWRKTSSTTSTSRRDRSTPSLVPTCITTWTRRASRSMQRTFSPLMRSFVPPTSATSQVGISAEINIESPFLRDFQFFVRTVSSCWCHKTL